MEWITAPERAALTTLRPRPAVDLEAEVVAAARGVWERRRRERLAAGAMFAVMRGMGHTWRGIEDVTGVPQATVRGWYRAWMASQKCEVVDDTDNVPEAS